EGADQVVDRHAEPVQNPRLASLAIAVVRVRRCRMAVRTERDTRVVRGLLPHSTVAAGVCRLYVILRAARRALEAPDPRLVLPRASRPAASAAPRRPTPRPHAVNLHVQPARTHRRPPSSANISANIRTTTTSPRPSARRLTNASPRRSTSAADGETLPTRSGS